jgi:hypothetical protein
MIGSGYDSIWKLLGGSRAEGPLVFNLKYVKYRNIPCARSLLK